MSIHPRQEISLFNPSDPGAPAVWESLKKLAPHLVIKNPVMVRGGKWARSSPPFSGSGTFSRASPVEPLSSPAR